MVAAQVFFSDPYYRFSVQLRSSRLFETRKVSLLTISSPKGLENKRFEVTGTLLGKKVMDRTQLEAT